MQSMNAASAPRQARDLDAPLVTRAMMVPFVLISTLFFLWAIPNNLNDVLIRQFMTSFVISRFQAGLIQSSFYLGYFILAIPAALIMHRWGYKSGFLIGLGFYTVGAFLFWPAAIVDRYSFFLVALFIIASGLSFLETASNPFIAQLGDPRSAARRLNLAQAFNPLGSIVGALIGTIFIFSGTELNSQQVFALKAQHRYTAYLHSETMRVVAPYVALSGLTLFILILIAVTRFPAELREAERQEQHGGNARALLRCPHFLLAVVAQFAYVGAQVGTWSYLIAYVQSYTHEGEKAAGYLLTGTLVLFAVGRFFSAWLMRHVLPSRLMAIYALVNTALAAIGVLFPGWIGVWALLFTSFFMSLMYPTIFAQGIRGLGANTKLAGSFIVMGIVGGAVLTPMMGWLSEGARGVALAYVVPLAAYVFVAFYSFVDIRLMRHPATGASDPSELPEEG